MPFSRFALLWLFAIAITLVIEGCSRPVDVNGQVFVVTRAAQNVKLGDVQVNFYSERDIAAWVRQSAAQAEALRSDFQTANKHHDDLINRVGQQKRALNSFNENEPPEVTDARAELAPLKAAQDSLPREFAQKQLAAVDEVKRQAHADENPHTGAGWFIWGDDSVIMQALTTNPQYMHSYFGAVTDLADRYRSGTYSASEFLRRFDLVVSAWKRDFEVQLNKHLPHQRAVLKAFFDEFNDGSRKLDESLSDIAKSVAAASRRVDDANAQKEMQLERFKAELESSRSQLKQSQEDVDQLRRRIVEWPHFDSLPPSKISTRTDADGTFNVTLPTSSRWALFSSATRMLSGPSEETYTWFLWFSPSSARQRSVLLTNSNLHKAGNGEPSPGY